MRNGFARVTTIHVKACHVWSGLSLLLSGTTRYKHSQSPILLKNAIQKWCTVLLILPHLLFYLTIWGWPHAFQRSGTSYHGILKCNNLREVPAWDNSKEIFTSKLSIFSSSPSPIRQNLRMNECHWSSHKKKNNNSHVASTQVLFSKRIPQKNRGRGRLANSASRRLLELGKIVASLGSLWVHSTKAKIPCVHGRCIIQGRWLCILMYLWSICVCIYYIHLWCFVPTACNCRNYDMEYFPLRVILWSSGSLSVTSKFLTE